MRHTRGRRLVATVAVGLLALVAAACVPEPPPSGPAPGPSGPPPPITAFGVSADPALYPAFSVDVTDYVVRCTGALVTITARVPDGTTVSIAGSAPVSGEVVAPVARTTGQSFTIVEQPPAAAARTYHVRCLPTDFPQFSASRTGTTEAEYYMVAPVPLAPETTTYAAIYDTNGVPMWWTPRIPTIYLDLLANGNLISPRNGQAAVQQQLDGAVVGTYPVTVGTEDNHDVLLLDNGNHVVVANVAIPNVDFSSWGASAPAGGTAPLLDHVIQEVDPGGNVVWSWSTYDHIPVSQTDPSWYGWATFFGPDYDAYHWNSIDLTPTGYLVSFRHLNAVYAINGTTGDIEWKLGGATTPESLTVSGDPVFTGGGTFSGQHDARAHADGSVSVYDNGSNVRPPRAVRYAINTVSGTATLVETKADAAVPSSPWGGSARRLPGGHWVMTWGGTDTATEVDAAGNRVFTWTSGPGYAGLYRMLPVLPGRLDRDALRAGMDAQHP